MNYSDIVFEWREGFRAGSQMIYLSDEQQIYRKNKILTNGDITYCCRLDKCKARVYLSSDKKRVYSRPEIMVHNHGPQDCEIKKMLVASEMKKRSMSGSEGGDTKKIFNDVMSE